MTMQCLFYFSSKHCIRVQRGHLKCGNEGSSIKQLIIILCSSILSKCYLFFGRWVYRVLMRESMSLLRPSSSRCSSNFRRRSCRQLLLLETSLLRSTSKKFDHKSRCQYLRSNFLSFNLPVVLSWTTSMWSPKSKIQDDAQSPK